MAGLLVVVSMFASLESGSTENGGGFLGSFLSGLFNVLRFPVHTLLGTVAESNNLLFTAGLVLNCLFYGLLYERIYTWLRRKKLKTPDEI